MKPQRFEIVLTCSDVLKASESILDSFQFWPLKRRAFKLVVKAVKALGLHCLSFSSAQVRALEKREDAAKVLQIARDIKDPRFVLPIVVWENLKTDARCKEQIDAFQPYLPVAFSLAAKCHLFRSTDASNAPIEGGGGK